MRPNTWKTIPLGEIAQSQYGLSLGSDDRGAVLMVGMKHLSDGAVTYNNMVRVLADVDTVNDYQLREDDLLFNRTNSYDLVGKTSIVDATVQHPTVFASYLVRLTIDELRALPTYVNYSMNWSVSQHRIKTLATPSKL